MKVLSGLDLNGNQITNVDAIIDGTENDIVKIGSNGELVDSGVSVSDIKPNVIESVSVNGMALTPTNKNVDIDLSDYVETANLATVAISGDYGDLSNTPDLSEYVMSSDLASVATSGDYGDLSNTPDLSEFISETDIYGMGIAFLSNLASVAISGDYGDLSNTPDLSEYVMSSDLASVATSGDYGDLSNTPDLSEYVMSSDLASVATTGDYEDLSNTPELAMVATSGSYEDLSDTPDLSDYVLSENLAAVATSGSYNDLEDRPNLSGYAAFFSLNILNEDSTDSFTFDATYISSDAIPIVQIVYENKIVTDGIEVSFNPSTGYITVQWDDTKYDVNSNTPLTVSVVGAPTEREDS